MGQDKKPIMTVPEMTFPLFAELLRAVIGEQPDLLASTFDLLQGLDVSEEVDTFPAELFDELFRPNAA